MIHDTISVYESRVQTTFLELDEWNVLCPYMSDAIMDISNLCVKLEVSTTEQLIVAEIQQQEAPVAIVTGASREAGADRVLACDLHSGQSMGYFDIPVDHVHGQPVIVDYLASKTIKTDDLVVVSPDVGGVARARAFAKKLSDAPLAIVDKGRHGHNVAEVMNLIGDVKGKVAVMVDDMIDTAE